jgi:hypothetical protein
MQVINGIGKKKKGKRKRIRSKKDKEIVCKE